MNNYMDKIFGIYCPYPLEMNDYKDYSEEELFQKIRHLSNSIYYTTNNPYGGIMLGYDVYQKQNLLDKQFLLEYLIYSTRRFGVEFSKEPKLGKHVESSKTYNEWYRHWNDWFDKLNNDEDKYNEYLEVVKSGLDISKFLPKKDWKEDTKITEQVVLSLLNDGFESVDVSLIFEIFGEYYDTLDDTNLYESIEHASDISFAIRNYIDYDRENEKFKLKDNLSIDTPMSDGRMLSDVFEGFISQEVSDVFYDINYEDIIMAKVSNFGFSLKNPGEFKKYLCNKEKKILVDLLGKDKLSSWKLIDEEMKEENSAKGIVKKPK